MADLKYVALALLILALIFIIVAFWFKSKDNEKSNETTVKALLIGSIICILAAGGMGFKQKSNKSMSDYMQLLIMAFSVILLIMSFYYSWGIAPMFITTIMSLLIAAQINDY